jgi:hypothetical protein
MIVMVDENTEDKFNDVNEVHGEINGFNKDGSQTPITVDQGLNTDAISYTFHFRPGPHGN